MMMYEDVKLKISKEVKYAVAVCINGSIKIARKYNADEDSVIDFVYDIVKELAENCTFTDYVIEEEI